MIYFNGIALENVAPVKVEDIRISPAALNVTARPRPIMPGADFIRAVDGTRTVTISFAILEQDITNRQAHLQAVADWAHTDTEGTLTLDQFSGEKLTCICTGYPEPSMRQWWESKLRIVFTAYNNPFWTATAEKSKACGSAFTVLGSVPPLMQIRHTFAAAASNVAYSDGTNTMTFSTIPAGNLVIDLNRQTAAVGGTSIMQYYQFGSAFILPAAGTHTITGTGTVYWYERRL